MLHLSVHALKNWCNKLTIGLIVYEFYLGAFYRESTGSVIIKKSKLMTWEANKVGELQDFMELI